MRDKMFDFDLPHPDSRFDLAIVYGVYGWIILRGLVIVMLLVASIAVMGLAVALDKFKDRLVLRQQQSLSHPALPLTPSNT